MQSVFMYLAYYKHEELKDMFLLKVSVASVSCISFLFFNIQEQSLLTDTKYPLSISHHDSNNCISAGDPDR